jgi:hypothetical protein
LKETLDIDDFTALFTRNLEKKRELYFIAVITPPPYKLLFEVRSGAPGCTMERRW